jgi:hypothetical protein
LNTTTIARGLAVAAAATVLGACGGGSVKARTVVPRPTGDKVASGKPTGPALSQIQLAAKVGAICSAAVAEGRRLMPPAKLTSDAHAAAAYFNESVPPLDAETRAFQALVPAPAASSAWEAVLASQVALDRLADGLQQKADAGQQTSLGEIGELISVGQTIASAAIRLGARCT